MYELGLCAVLTVCAKYWIVVLHSLNSVRYSYCHVMMIRSGAEVCRNKTSPSSKP